MALAMGVLPATSAPATADVVSPAVSYLDVASQPGNRRWLSSASPTGASPVRLTPSSYYTYSYDASQDGNTVVMGVKTEASLTSNYDHTYGLVLVERDAGTVTSTILTNNWDSEPAVSADGSMVWWMTDGAIWKHAGGVTTNEATHFTPASGEEVQGLAISPDGTNAAVLYVTDSTHSRILATDMRAGRSEPWFENVFTVDQPTSYTFVWIDDDRLLVSMDPGSGDDKNMVVTMSDTGISPGSPPNAALDGFYDIRPLGTDWWMWKDDVASQVTSYGVTADLSGPAPTLTARSNGDTTFRYVPSAITPPALTVASNRATTHPTLVLSASTQTYGLRVVYAAGAAYLNALPGQTLEADASEVDRGILQRSTNGSTWATVGWTSWASPVPWPGDPGYYGNAYSPVLTRNTWFRWVYPGDYMTRASTSSVRKVVVTPRITAKVVKKGAKRVVSGTVTRIGGKVYLYKGSRKLATATLTARGAYTFKARSLSRGTYSVKVRADASWGAASKKLKV